MFKVSDIISMPVISLYESEYQGIIYNIIFDFKTQKCKYFFVLNEEDGIKRVLNANDIYQIGQECVFIKNESVLELECNYDSKLSNYSNPLNLKVFDLYGKLLGTSSDIILDEKLSIQSIILNNDQTIQNKNILNLGKTIILINDSNINITKFKPKQKTITISKTKKNKVVILSELNNTPTSHIPTKPIENNTINKIITDFKFLVGRILSKDIIATNGEMIAKTGTTVTKDIINKASYYGKLVEVARHSKK